MSIVVIQRWNQPREVPAILEPAAKGSDLRVLPQITHYTICILCGSQVSPCYCKAMAAHIHDTEVCGECRKDLPGTAPQEGRK